MVATRKGITTIFDREHPRSEAGPYVIPLDVMAGSNDIYTFDMELDASEAVSYTHLTLPTILLV